MAQPEKLSLWDRIFNRTKQEIIEEGEESWSKRYNSDHLFYPGQYVPNSNFRRSFVKYKLTNRLTGSETIKKVYLN